MKYAIISDIHGNMPALEAVLKDAQNAGVDKYVFVGDYYLCSPFPNEVTNKIKSMENAYIVRGNEEDHIEKLAKQDQLTWTDGQFSALYWCFCTITNENKKYLTSLPERLEELNGNWFIKERRVKYDLELLVNDLLNSELYKQAKVWSDNTISELKTGYEHVEFFLKFVNEYANEINDSVRPYSRETWEKAYDIWRTK